MSTEPTPATEPASSVFDTEMRVQTVCQMIFATFAVFAGLYWLRPVLLPFILALFFVFGLVPILDYIQRRMKAPRMVAVGVAFMLGLILISLLGLLIWLSVDSLVANSDVYRQRITDWQQTITSWFDLGSDATDSVDATPEISAATGSPVDDGPVVPDPSGSVASENELPATTGQATVEEEASLFDSLLGNQTPAFMHSFPGAVMSFLSSALMVVIFMFFLLLGGSSDIVPRTGFWIEVEASIRQYIVTKTVISVVTGAVFSLVLWLFGVPLALVFGILAFLLNYIPNVGPVIAALLPIPLIVLDPEMSVVAMAAVITLAILVQFVSGNIVEPKMMGDSVQLHPVAILIALLFWGLIWGIVGMFLATPITAAIKILLERFEHTKVIAQVLEGDLSGVSFSSESNFEPATETDG